MSDLTTEVVVARLLLLSLANSWNRLQQLSEFYFSFTPHQIPKSTFAAMRDTYEP